MRIVHTLSRQQPDRALATAVFEGHVAFASPHAVHVPTGLSVVAGNAALVEAFGGKAALDDQERAELIEAINLGKHLEVEADLLSYRQPRQPGVKLNAHGVRVRAGGFRRMAKSAAQTVLLKNHDWQEMASRAGTIIKAHTAELDSELLLHERARFTAGWAVKSLLEGNFDRLSVGLVATGPVHCTVCKAPVRECWHWPFDELDGQVVEWEMQEARKVETSGVNVPAVDNTSVDHRFAAPAGDRAEHLEQRKQTTHSTTGPDGQEIPRMDELEELRAALEKERAERARLSDRMDRFATELTEAKSERDQAQADLDVEREANRRKEATRLCDELVAQGKLSADSALYEHLVAQYCEHGKDKAETLAAGLQAGNPAMGESQRSRARQSETDETRKQWSIPRTDDGAIDRKKLLASMPPKIKERVESLMARSSYAKDPLGVVRSLANPLSAGDKGPSRLAQLLEADGYEPIARKDLD